MADDDDAKMEQVRVQLRQAEANIHVLIESFGDLLATRKGYQNIRGMEAVWFHLIEKHHWTPATVRALNIDDLQLVLSQDMADFRKVPWPRKEKK